MALNPKNILEYVKKFSTKLDCVCWRYGMLLNPAAHQTLVTNVTRYSSRISRSPE